LSYNVSQVNINNLKIIPIELKLDESIYNGTIIDGILLPDNSNKSFVINDVYMFRGKNISNEKINHKIMNTVAYFKSFFKKDSNINQLNITINKLYEYTDIKKLVYNDIPKQKNFSIKGIAFYPEISNTKLIYFLNAPQNNNKNIIVKQQYQNLSQPILPILPIQPIQPIQLKSSQIDTHLITENKKTIKYTTNNSDVILTFEIKKTDIIDVYKLFLADKIKKDGKTILKSKKIDIAYIPTMDCSNMCKKLFEINNDRILINCSFIKEKNKWLPINQELIKKYPDIIAEVSHKINLLDIYEN
jgi:hypothetical protein